LLDKMIGTATPIQWQDGTSMDLITPFKRREDGTGLAPVAQQGGGMVSAVALLDTTTTGKSCIFSLHGWF
jgi:hypothetical protein